MSISTEITRLQTAKSDIKTAIENKGVIVPSDASISYYDDYVGQIQTGGADMTMHIRNASGLFARSKNLPTRIVLNFPDFGYELNNSDRGTTDYMFIRAFSSNIEIADIDVTINFPSVLKYFTLSNAFYQAYGLKNIKITGNLSGVYSYVHFIDFSSNIEVLDMEFDFTSCSTQQIFHEFGPDNILLTDIRFKSKTLGQNCNILKLKALNDVSLISIANGISDSVTGKTLTLNATHKARLSTIMGVVSGGTFTADVSGTVSLEEFITITKGWTIA